jgi:hypothetical protein
LVLQVSSYLHLLFLSADEPCGSNAHTIAYGGSLTATPSTSSQTATTVTITPTVSPASHGVPVGALVGGAVGGFALFVIAVLLVLFWMRRRKRKTVDQGTSVAHGDIPTMSCAYPSQGLGSPILELSPAIL